MNSPVNWTQLKKESVILTICQWKLPKEKQRAYIYKDENKYNITKYPKTVGQCKKGIICPYLNTRTKIRVGELF